MTNTLTYREGSIDDLQQLIALGVAAYGIHATAITPEHWAYMSAALHNEERASQLIAISTIFVCTDGDRIVGMAYLLPSGNPTDIYLADWSYVRMVGVHPDYRGNGICKRLMQQCVDRARATGEQIIGLHTSAIMNDARHIYEKMGFVQVKDLEPVYGLQYWLFRMEL